jgi:hypothetical protein
MQRSFALLSLAAALIVPASAQKSANPFVGRWDMTVTTPKATYPSWMEVVDKEGSPQVRVQPRGGSVHPVTAAKIEGARLILTVSPQATWELTAAGDRLTGTQKRGDTEAGQLTGIRAPALKRSPPKAWTTPEPLFNGKDLSGWEPTDPAAANHWVARDGVLLNESKGANLRTTRKFDDFKLHIEFNCPEKGNSGIYLRGRYEVQVEYEPEGSEDKYHRMGAVYGMVPVTADVPRKVGEWESFDITLVGRTVTIVRDGVTIIDNQEIAGITGGALDSNEGEPGPFYFQGDHTGGMKYRNITVSVPKR